MEHKDQIQFSKKDNDTACDIILFPEIVKLKEEVENLRTEISRLLLERDELRFVICKNIETAYLLALGALEYKFFELNCEVLRLKRKIELIQTKKNRQEEISLAVIDEILDQEFASFQRQLNEQIDKMNKAFEYDQGRPLTDDEMKEIKKLYRSIVKVLHPDLNPDLSPEKKQLFHNAVQAYENGDLVHMRIISEMISEPIDTENGENAISNLMKDRDRFKKTVETILKQIEAIKSEYPYTMKELIHDPSQVADKKAELETMIAELKEVHTLYAERLKEMMR